jgi:hypothetical protein
MAGSVVVRIKILRPFLLYGPGYHFLWCVNIFSTKVIDMIQPGYNVSKQVVRRCDMLRKGDVITFPYVGLDHEGVITEMTPLSDNLSEVVKVTVVHFNYVGLFGTRTQSGL